MEGNDRNGKHGPRLQTFLPLELWESLLMPQSCFLAEHLRYVSAFSPPCHPVPMINVEQSDRIPVAMSLRGDER